ncbi:MAG TPA: cytochrome c3 family protein, partial [Verrucomicrobiae bacterium]|nr:cytochrome c3 family protein [Verrucomicrobiae bacterium]
MAIITPHTKQLKNKGRKKEVSKKYALVAVLALVLALGFASTVLAAQNVDYSGSPTDGVNDFAPTPVDDLYFPNEANPGAYKIHSNYTATTDACASCHSTHTAVGEALLQLGSATDVCMACHDGSVTTTYDVKNGLIGNTTMPTSGGMFGDMNTTLSSKSTHNVKGTLSVYAAPGGPGTPGVEAGAVWNKEFGCESCHSPHGTGGNARILNPDVNGVAVAAYAKGAYNLVNGVNVGGSKGVPLVKDNDGTYYSNWKKVDPTARDQWLWSGHSYRSNTKVYVNGVQKTVNTDYTLNNTAGFTKVTFVNPPAADAVVTADIYPGVVVQMNVSNYLQTNEKVQ